MKIQKISYHFIKYNKRTWQRRWIQTATTKLYSWTSDKNISRFAEKKNRYIFLLVAILLCMDAERICERPFKANFHSDIDYFKKKKQIFTRMFLSMLLRYVLVWKWIWAEASWGFFKLRLFIIQLHLESYLMTWRSTHRHQIEKTNNTTVAKYSQMCTLMKLLNGLNMRAMEATLISTFQHCRHKIHRIHHHFGVQRISHIHK